MEYKKAKLSAAVISQNFQRIWIKFGLLLRCVGEMKLIIVFFSSIQYSSERIVVL